MLRLMKQWMVQSVLPRDTAGPSGSQATGYVPSDPSESTSAPSGKPHTVTSADCPPPTAEMPSATSHKSPHSSEEPFRLHASGDDFEEETDTDTPVYKRSKKVEMNTQSFTNLTFPPVSTSESPLAGTSTTDRDESEDAEKQLDLAFRAAIEALYTLVPDLPAPVEEVKQGVTPMSRLASDPRKEDTSKYKYFPQSTLIQGCVDQVHEYWWDLPKAQADLSLPKSMPPNASGSKPLDARIPTLAGFKDSYYKDPNASVPIEPPPLGGTWERSFGKAPATITVDHAKFVAMERMIRRVVATISSIDVLVAGLRQHSTDWEGMSEEQRAEASSVTARLTSCLTMAISHAAAISVRASATCVQTRRKAALESARKRDIPEPMREWLLCQPLPSEKGFLFGPAVPTLINELAVDVHELRKGMALMTKPPRSDTRQEGGFGKGQKRKKSFGRGTPPQQQTFQPQGQSFARGRDNFRRKKKGGGRGKPSFPPPPASTTPKGESTQRS